MTSQCSSYFYSHYSGENESRVLDVKSVDSLEFRGDRPIIDLENKNDTFWSSVLYKGKYDTPCEADPQLCAAELVFSTI